MSEDVRNFVGLGITEIGQIKLKSFMGLEDEKSVFMLIGTDCIEIRTRKQHEALLSKLAEAYERTKKQEYKALYDKVLTYSKILPVNLDGEISLGKRIVELRKFEKRIVAEKCKGCIKIWHPKMFKAELDEYTAKAGRGRV